MPLFLNALLTIAVLSCIIACIFANNQHETASSNSNFLKWFNENGGKNFGVGISFFEGMGRGIVANEEIDASKDILFVPKHLIFSLEFLKSSKDSTHNNIAKAFADDDQTAVIAALLWEKSLGSKSFYHPYIDVLPRSIHNLLAFSDLELRELQHPELESSALFAQKGLSETMSSFKRAVERFWPSANEVTLADFHWATSVVDSRGLRFSGKVYLTPFADMFNYSPHPDPRVASDGNFFLNHHILSDEGIKISSDRKQLQNSQVYEDYGDNTDTNYAMYHGFVANENPFSCIKVQTPPFMDVSSEKVLDLVKKLQFKSAPGQCVDKNMKFSKALIVYLTSLSFSTTERKRCMKLANITNPNFGHIFEKCGYKDVAEFVYKYMDDVKEFGLEPAKELAVDVMNDFEGLENRFMTFANKWVDNIFPKYPTTREDDEAELAALANSGENTPSKEHKALALRYRIKQKKLWRNLCDAFGSACKIDPSAVAAAAAAAAEASKKAAADAESKKASSSSSTSTATKTSDEFSTGSNSLDQDIAAFNAWFDEACDREGAIHKIAAATMPRYRIGTVTTADVKDGEVYLQVPTSIIIDGNKAKDDPDFGPLILDLNDKVLKGRDAFTELLLFLIDQRFVKRERSHFWPYLSVLPKPSDLDVPSLWTSEEVTERLKPSYIEQQVQSYRERMVRAYQTLLKMEGISKFFPGDLLTFEKFRWAYIILDSRSIWWNNERHLVPMLDFINCKEGIEGNAKARVHATALDETGNFAVTKAGFDYKSGDQLFENYGQPNLIYFQYHGFALTAEDGGNSHDCAHFELNITREDGSRVNWESASDIIKRLRLRQQAVIQACLAHVDKIPESVWLFLSLKMNNFDALRESNELGVPTKEGVTFLMRLVDDRLRGYENYASRHFSSRKFIRSEEAIYQSFKQELQALLLTDFEGGNDEL